MASERSQGLTPVMFLCTGLLVIFFFGFLVYPLLYVFVRAFSFPGATSWLERLVLPLHHVFRNPVITESLLNSLLLAVAVTILTTLVSLPLAHIFAKYRFRFRQPLFWYLMALMMVPPSVLMIPNYLILSRLGLLNNLWGLVITVVIDPFAVFVMRQFIIALPDDQIESARIDGATEWRIYRSIVLPQIKPALATLGLLTFMFNWNAYLWPLIVLTENDKRTIPVILTWYSTQHSAELNLVMAASVLMVVPVLIFFVFTQRWIVTGLTLSGGK